MKGIDNRYAFFPSLKQELLLKAALLGEKEAASAWEQYGAYINRETIDHASQRVLPLLYQNLNSLGITMEQKNFLQGVYRNYWYSNKLLFNKIQPILNQLKNADIKVMLLKGAALTYGGRYYSSQALRPMSDIDIMVPVNQVSKTIKILSSAAYKPENIKQNILKNSVGDEYLWLRHSEDFVDKEGNSLDLHWHLMTECAHSTIDAILWETAEEAEDDSSALYYLPSPTLQLIHICVHGAKVNAMHPLRWIPDAYMIIKGSDIDWEELSNFAVQYHLVVPLSATLMYLKNTFSVHIPDQVFEKLSQEKISLIERAEFYIRHHGKGYRNSLYKHFAGFLRYLYGRKRDSSYCAKEAMVSSVNYIKYIWRMPSIWLLPFYILKYAVRIILRGIKRVAQFLIGKQLGRIYEESHTFFKQ